MQCVQMGGPSRYFNYGLGSDNTYHVGKCLSEGNHKPIHMNKSTMLTYRATLLHISFKDICCETPLCIGLTSQAFLVFVYAHSRKSCHPTSKPVVPMAITVALQAETEPDTLVEIHKAARHKRSIPEIPDCKFGNGQA